MSITESPSQPELTSETIRRLERRLALRVLALWRDVRGDQVYASPEDINPHRLGNMWPHCFLLRLNPDGEPIVEQCGDALTADCGRAIVNLPLSEVPSHSLLHNAAHSWRYVETRQVPVTRGGDVENVQGAIVLFRSVLIPLSTNQHLITHMLGAVNGRIAGGGV